MAINWAMKYTLDATTYSPLQKGEMSSKITNKGRQKIIVTRVGLNFDWQGMRYWFQDCNIEVKPGEEVDLPTVGFTVKLEASDGAHLYKSGVVYKVLTKSGWELRGKDMTDLTYVQRGKHVMISEAPEHDFEVFLSHSNADEDKRLLDKCIASFNRCGINMYVAERSPEPGYPLWQKIEAAIRRADAILILWTESGSQSGDIREEIGIAIGAKKSKRIIPLVQTGLTTQGSLAGLEHVPLDIDDPLEALTTVVSRTLEWADKKERGKPKVEPTPPVSS